MAESFRSEGGEEEIHLTSDASASMTSILIPHSSDELGFLEEGGSGGGGGRWMY